MLEYQVFFNGLRWGTIQGSPMTCLRALAAGYPSHTLATLLEGGFRLESVKEDPDNG